MSTEPGQLNQLVTTGLVMTEAGTTEPEAAKTKSTMFVNQNVYNKLGHAHGR